MTNHWESEQLSKNGWFLGAVLFLFLSAAIWYAFWQEMYLSADGVFYFVRILDNGSFLNYS
jgi:hypothetical protein